MTKKDYEVLASALYKARVTSKHDLYECLIRALKKDNPRFIEQAFREAVDLGTP